MSGVVEVTSKKAMWEISFSSSQRTPAARALDRPAGRCPRFSNRRRSVRRSPVGSGRRKPRGDARHHRSPVRSSGERRYCRGRRRRARRCLRSLRSSRRSRRSGSFRSRSSSPRRTRCEGCPRHRTPATRTCRYPHRMRRARVPKRCRSISHRRGPVPIVGEGQSR